MSRQVCFRSGYRCVDLDVVIGVQDFWNLSFSFNVKESPPNSPWVCSKWGGVVCSSEVNYHPVVGDVRDDLLICVFLSGP